MQTTNAQTNSGHAHDKTYSGGSSIEAFFAEKVIFITGATGFLGKALLEKLLHSCPRVATIFVLIRSKRNQSIEDRFKKLLENTVFDRIRSEFPGALNKILPVKGDVCMPDLGLQPEDKDMLIRTELNPYTLIDICENLNDETIGIIEKKLLGNHPNTYTLTKNLAEQIVLSKGSGLPIAIVRPSIICAAYQEPFPGWIDNEYGVTGLMTEIGRGTFRSLICNANLILDIVPVDFVVDTLICASWYNVVQCTDTIRIYNCTSGPLHPITWREFGHLTRKHAIEFPSKYVMWYPGCTFRTNKLIHAIIVATLHFLPTFIMDLVLRVRGYKPIMMKISKRIHHVIKVGGFVSINEWKFYADNMTKLMKFVRASGDNSFNLDIGSMDWDTYFYRYMLGIRKYILKDNLDTLNNARSRLWRLYWMHKLTKIFGIFVLLGMIKYLVISLTNYMKTFKS